MKRIKYACLEQTIHFMLKEDMERGEAAALARRELEGYKAGLDRRHTKYKVEEERTEADGSVMLRIKKQYNAYPCGGYLN